MLRLLCNGKALFDYSRIYMDAVMAIVEFKCHIQCDKHAAQEEKAYSVAMLVF